MFLQYLQHQLFLHQEKYLLLQLKEFYEIIFAPAVGVSFIATVDDAPLPIIVVPYTPTS